MSIIATASASLVGSAFLKKLAPIILKAGAPILADIVKNNVGSGAGKIVEAVATRLGVPPTPEAITERYEAEPDAVENAIREVEVQEPEYWIYVRDADQLRAAMFKQEAAEPWWAWAWRPAWMWLLAGFWIWTAIAVALGIGHIDFATMIFLTTAYLGLYMGGHTIKAGVETWAKARGARSD